MGVYPSPFVYSVMFGPYGAEHRCPEFLLVEAKFQHSLTVLRERDELQDLYLEVQGALVVGLGKV